MNTKYIYKISNYLFICMLALAVFACKDDDNSEDTSALTLVSSNITEGATLESNSGYVELTFNKKVRQAPNTSITFNDADIRIIILNNVVRYNTAHQTIQTVPLKYLPEHCSIIAETRIRD